MNDDFQDWLGALLDAGARFLGREDLIRNKRATGRAKDLADLDVLECD